LESRLHAERKKTYTDAGKRLLLFSSSKPVKRNREIYSCCEMKKLFSLLHTQKEKKEKERKSITTKTTSYLFLVKTTARVETNN